MSVWSDITKGVSGAAKDVTSTVNQMPFPFINQVNKAGSDVSSAIGKALHDAGHFIAGQDVPGSQVPGMGGPTTFGQAVQNLGDPKSPAFLQGGNSGSKKPDPKPAAATPAAQTAPTQQASPDALTAGLGMFFSQYLAPMMQQISGQNNQMISQWGDAMNYALAQPLPAGVKAIMQPWVGQNQQMLGMINQAGAQQVAGQIPFTTLMNQVGNQTTAMQAMTEAFTKAATEQELGISNPTALQTAIQQSGGLPAGLNSLVQMLGNTSTLPGVPGVPTTPGANTQKPATTIPGTTTPTTTPSTTTSTGTQSAPAQQLAAQIAAALQAQQLTAGQANTVAGAGYTPPTGQ